MQRMQRKESKYMYDQVTLGLNVDPFILSALKEDITSEDVSTNSVMPHPQAGEVDLICKQDGIICGLQVFERVFTLLDADTKVEFYVKDGDKVENKQLIGKVYGDIRVLLCGERTALKSLNIIAKRAYGKDNYYTDASQEAVLEALVDEYFLEFPAEGVIWWALIRLDKIWDYNDYLAANRNKTNILLWPISKSARDKNSNLTQTEGWY